MTDLEPEPPSRSPYDLDSDADIETEVRAEATTSRLAKVGLALQVIGVVGAVAWALLTYVSWDRGRQSNNGFPPGWKTQVQFLLSPILILVQSAVVFAAGAVCRLLAEWSELRLRDRYLAEQVAQRADDEFVP